MKKIFGKINIEAFVLSGGLIYLFFIDPSRNHFSICLFKLAGIDFCPGCGLGRSISYLLHFNLNESLHSHYLGIPALIIIVYRIIYLITNRPAAISLNNSFVPGGTQQK